MIFCGVDAYFPWVKGGGLKNFGPEFVCLSFFFFLHQPPPYSVCQRSLKGKLSNAPPPSTVAGVMASGPVQNAVRLPVASNLALSSSCLHLIVGL